MKRDQFNNAVPSDLVTLPDFQNLSEPEVVQINRAAWYDVNGIILVSAKAIDYLSENDPLDSGIDLEKNKIYFIAHALHRFNPVDGWYHA